MALRVHAQGGISSKTFPSRNRLVAFRPICKAAQEWNPSSGSDRACKIGRSLLAGVASCLVLASSAIAGPSVIEGPARVVDGDTLVINGERIRLYGIDAPESAQQCQDARGTSYPCGLVSKDALAKKIGSASVKCDVKTTDQYGRNVSICGLKSLAGGFEDLNAWLVSNGYAVAYRQYGKDYVPLEDSSHAAAKGIWQGQFQVPSEWRKANKRSESGPVQSAVGFVPPAAAKSTGGDPVPQCANGPAIKGNINSGGDKIYHVSGGRYYDSVRIDLKDGEKFFCTETDAKAAGWRPSAQ